MNTIPQIEAEIIEEFEFLEDWTDKYQHIIDMTKTMLPLTDAEKCPENLIRGCQSQVWLVAELIDNKLIFRADSDAIITKGLVALLIRVLSGHSPREVFTTPLVFLEKIGIQSHLSPTRANGLHAMLTKMKTLAIAFDNLMHK
jgi:cysteine desulfuration protein SufE